MESILETIKSQGMRLVGGLAVLVIGFILARWLIKVVQRSEKYVKMEPTLKSFLSNALRLVLYIVVILTAINVMGIPMTSVVTLLASGSVAVSLAMQGALSNLVGGLMLLILKPIKVGEYVKTSDVEGTVRSIGTFYTELTMPDNRHVSVPNSTLTNTSIINYTREGTRRLDVTYAISYNADMEQVFALLTDLVKRREDVLPDPAPVVHISAMNDSSVSYVVRLWCKGGDYWNLFYYLTEEGKRALDQAGIEIPYPQMDVHVK